MSTNVGKKLDKKLSVSDAGSRKQSLYPDQSRSLLEAPAGDKQRRPSIDFSHRRPSITDTRKMSIVESIPGRSTLIMTSAHTQRQNVRYENTYKTDPDVKVRSDYLKDCIKSVFEDELSDLTYNKEQCPALTKKIAEELKRRVKSIGLPRYKIITVVAIGQREQYNPSVAFTSRCVWSAAFDTFSEYTFKSPSLYAVGLVYALYAE